MVDSLILKVLVMSSVAVLPPPADFKMNGWGCSLMGNIASLAALVV